MKKIFTLLMLLCITTLSAMADVTFNVDDPNGCTIVDSSYKRWGPSRYAGDSSTPLVLGDNALPAGSYQINPYSGSVLKKVTVNGVEQTKPYSSATYYSVTVKDGDKVVITTKDEVSSYALTISGAPDGYITSVQAGGETITGTSESGVLKYDIPSLKKVVIYADETNFKVNKITVNGTERTSLNGYSYDATQAMAIDCDVTTYTDVQATLNVDATARVEVRVGSSQADKMTIVDGDNKITLKGNNNTLYISPAHYTQTETDQRWYAITGVTATGQSIISGPDASGSYSVSVVDGDVITVTSELKSPATGTATISADDIDGVIVKDAHRAVVTLDDFDATTVNVGRYYISAAEDYTISVTVNDVAQTASSGEYALDLVNGDKVEIKASAKASYTWTSTSTLADMLTTIQDGEKINDYPVAVEASDKWASIIFPFGSETIPDGVKVYTAKEVSNGCVVLQEQGSISAWEPYIISASEDFETTMSGKFNKALYENGVTDGVITSESSALVGCVSAQEINSGYVLQNLDGDNEVCFHQVNSSLTVPSGKVYLKSSAVPSGAKKVTFIINGVTAINNVLSTEGKASKAGADANVDVEKADCYNLAGQRVNAAQHGIYIIGGKKIVK